MSGKRGRKAEKTILGPIKTLDHLLTLKSEERDKNPPMEFPREEKPLQQVHCSEQKREKRRVEGKGRKDGGRDS